MTLLKHIFAELRLPSIELVGRALHAMAGGPHASLATVTTIRRTWWIVIGTVNMIGCLRIRMPFRTHVNACMDAVANIILLVQQRSPGTHNAVICRAMVSCKTGQISACSCRSMEQARATHFHGTLHNIDVTSSDFGFCICG